MPKRKEMQKRYRELKNKLPITSNGYEYVVKHTEVFEVDTYLATKDPFYSEFIIIPDGRIIPAIPSHSAVMDSLLNFLWDDGWDLSPQWLVEERLYYTGAIQCWEMLQQGFEEPMKAQKTTMEKLIQSGSIKESAYTCYNADKRDYFIRNKERIHEEAVDFNKEYKEEQFLKRCGDPANLEFYMALDEIGVI